MSTKTPGEEDEYLKQLISSAKKGEGQALGQIYDLFVGQIFRFVYFKTSNRLVAEDLTQNVFLKVLENIGQYKNSGYFTAWLFSIARNLVTDYYRSRKVTLKLENVQGLLASNEVDFETKEFLAETLKALGTLKQDEQEVVILHGIEEYSFEEIAKITNKSSGSLRVLKHRALQKLKKTLNYEQH